MDIAHLREYLVLADCLNFNTAARRLYISQPTLSRHMQAMEDEVGVRLLDRDRQGVSLTPAGDAARRHFERALSAYEDALRAAADADDPRARTLRVANPPLYMHFPWAFDLMMAVKERFPDIITHGVFTDSDDRVALLLDGAVDAALVLVPYGTSIADVHLTDIGEASLCLIAPESLNLNVDEDSLTQLKGVHIAVPTFDPRIRYHINELLKHMGIPPEHILPCDSMDEALTKAMAPSDIPIFAVGFDIGEAFSRVLRCAPLRGEAFTVRACLATRKDDRRTATADLVSCAQLLGNRETHG